MFDQLYYIIMKNSLKTVINNIDEIIDSINTININCPKALVLNNSTNYKSSIVNIKDKLSIQKTTIKNEIIKEIDNKLIR